MKKVLITGGSGLVGSHLRIHEKARAFDIICPTRDELNLLEAVAVQNFVSLHKPDCVIHAAGLVGGIQANIHAPTNFIIENTVIGINVLRACADASVPNVINLGSSCMYPRDALNPLVETSLYSGELEPTNEGYALAKLLVSKLGQAFRRLSEQCDFVTVIPCNLYGPYDHFEPERSHLLAAIINKIHKAKYRGDRSVEIWGSGSSRREFMYAEDLADCLWLMVQTGVAKLPDFVNVGVGIDHSILDYYKVVAKSLEYGGEFVFDRSRPEGMKQKLMDSSCINNWGWRPETELEDGILKTYEYYLRLDPHA